MKIKLKRKEKIDLTNSYFKYSLPAELIKELAKELKNINLYPSGGKYIKLRQVLADYVGVKTENIFPANGSDEVIDIITRSYKGKVLIPIPTFFQYEISADRLGLPKILVNCLRNREYIINYSTQQLDKASLAWICNPNNPTGSEIPRDKIIDILQRAKGMVIVDECNYEYLGKTVIDLIDKYPNLVISRSFSKSFGLAGLRLGFAISNPQNIKRLATFGQYFRVNRMAEKAAEKVLKYLDYKEECKKIWKYLKENNIYTLPGWEKNEFSGLEDQFIRFTIGKEWEMDRVAEVLAKY